MDATKPTALKVKLDFLMFIGEPPFILQIIKLTTPKQADGVLKLQVVTIFCENGSYAKVRPAGIEPTIVL